MNLVKVGLVVTAGVGLIAGFAGCDPNMPDQEPPQQPEQQPQQPSAPDSGDSGN